MNLQKELDKISAREKAQREAQAEKRKAERQKLVDSMKYWVESPLGNN